MAFPIHHVFVLTASGAPEADTLVELGLIEGSSNSHPGQGTANRRFFFRNAMLELLWVAEPSTCRRPPASGLRLYERWAGRNTGASPFGICVGPSAGADAARSPGQLTEGAGRPFDGWAYRPAYLPDNLAITVAETRLDEPLLFQVPFGPVGTGSAPSEPFEHGLGPRELTQVTVSSPVAATSRACVELAEAAPVRFETQDGGRPVMSLTFDEGRAGGSADLRPTLPLVLRW